MKRSSQGPAVRVMLCVRLSLQRTASLMLACTSCCGRWTSSTASTTATLACMTSKPPHTIHTQVQKFNIWSQNKWHLVLDSAGTISDGLFQCCDVYLDSLDSCCCIRQAKRVCLTMSCNCIHIPCRDAACYSQQSEMLCGALSGCRFCVSLLQGSRR